MVWVAGFRHVEEVDGAVLETLIDGQDRQAATGAVQERQEAASAADRQALQGVAERVGHGASSGWGKRVEPDASRRADATRSSRLPVRPEPSTATRTDVELMISPRRRAYVGRGVGVGL